MEEFFLNRTSLKSLFLKSEDSFLGFVFCLLSCLFIIHTLFITVDGQWSGYSTVSWNNDCSTTCGVGVETGIKTRTCTNPTPAYGGNPCYGVSSSTQKRQCQLKECPSKNSR